MGQAPSVNLCFGMGDVFCSCRNPDEDQLDIGEENIAGDQSLRFTGRWITGKGNVHIIGCEAIQWSNGDLSVIQVERRHGGKARCITEIKEERYTAELTPDDRLLWSDGDVWVRDV